MLNSQDIQCSLERLRDRSLAVRLGWEPPTSMFRDSSHPIKNQVLTEDTGLILAYRSIFLRKATIGDE